MRPTLLLLPSLVIPLMSACADEPPLGGVEPRLACAAVGIHVDAPSVVDRYAYTFDRDGRPLTALVLYADGGFHEHVRRYEDGLLVTERISSPDHEMTRTITNVDGRPRFANRRVVDDYWGRDDEYRDEWTWREDERGLALTSLVSETWSASGTLYRNESYYDELRTGEVGFRESYCASGASYCSEYEYVGPYDYVGDPRGWTTKRYWAAIRDDMRVVEERAFDRHNLVVSHAFYDEEGGLARRTTYDRGDDGTLRAATTEVPGRADYYYEPRYDCAP